MIHLSFSYWWLFGLALVLVLLIGDDVGRLLVLLVLVIVFLTTVACKLAAHFGLL